MEKPVKSFIDDWSKTIKKIGDQSREREAKELKELKEITADYDPSEFSNKVLIAAFKTMCTANHHNPAFREQYKIAEGKLEKEIMDRLHFRSLYNEAHEKMQTSKENKNG